jgi:hypothetical protein
MTKDEARMTNEIPMMNDTGPPHAPIVICDCIGVRISAFVIGRKRRRF